MARSILLNSRPVAGPIAIVAGQRLDLILVLTDADATVGDQWEATVTGGGLTFAQPGIAIPAGATSPVSLHLEAPGGFTQVGTFQINVCKIAGAGANPAVPIWTIDFQVAAAQAAPQPQAVIVAQPQPAPVAAAAAQPGIPQPLQVQVTGVNGGAWVNGLSAGVVIFSILLLLVCGWIVYELLDAISLSGQMNAVGAASQEGILIENYDITLKANPGGRIVAGDDPTAIVNGIKTVSTTTH